MATVKTAVSLDKPLFQKTSRLARKMKLSRSRLVALALDEFMRRRDDEEIVKRLNEVYGEQGGLNEEDKNVLAAARRHHAKLLADDKW